MIRILLAGTTCNDKGLSDTLQQAGYGVEHAADTESIQRTECSIVIYGADAERAALPLTALGRNPFIVVSNDTSPRVIVRAMRAGASDYLTRPYTADELLAALEHASTGLDGYTSDTASNSVLASMLGECVAMLELIERIRKVGATDSPVLITGETGSGKEMLGRAVHASSTRRHLPMVVMNCAAVPETFQEAELFGDAALDDAPSSGLIEAAHDSSLFLDDIAGLTLASQAKLLRVLQSNENRRMGAATARPVDVRIITSSQHDLSRLVRDRVFREDLYYRLNVVTLTPPPLRERSSDRLLLAEHFLERSSRKLGRVRAELTDEARAAIDAYRWPGNIRELENAVERALILASDHRITAELLGIDKDLTATSADADSEHDQNISLEEYFVKFVLENQDLCSETELAERLGISRKSLWERRQRLNIPRKKTRKRAPRRS